MITLKGYPKNGDKFIRLTAFLKDALDLFYTLNVSPVLDGSFAIFAYTGDFRMEVNDVDLGCSKLEFPKIMKVLDSKKIKCILKEYKVLQILKDDLKIEIGAVEVWYKKIPLSYETLKIDDYMVKILSPESLVALYKQAMEDRKSRVEAAEKYKYQLLKSKYEMLTKFFKYNKINLSG